MSSDYFVTCPCGTLKGTRGRAPGTVAFKGIRYASAGRWEYPTVVSGWDGVYDATQYGKCSYQPRSFYNEEENLKKVFYYNEFRRGESYEYSEDCLFLNIWIPEGAKEGDKLPVIVYIHGGGFTGGCGHEKHFDGPVWPAMGVIAVTINYRLGPMGFVCLPQLKDEAGICGNYGLYDQLAALKWIRDNISSFGGDSDNVTIMGQSAGAMSVQQHCMSPLSAEFFHKAVMSSGGGVSRMLSYQRPEKSYDFWLACMKKAGCETLEEFRSIEPERLFAIWQDTKKEVKGGGCFPCIDGMLVVDTAANQLSRGSFSKVPYMAGGTSEDIFPPIICFMARKWCSIQSNNSYSWYFDRRLPGDDKGAWHSSDLWYWFGTLENCWRPMEDKDKRLSHAMASALCNFARTGDPNGDGLRGWAPASISGRRMMHFGEGEPKMTAPPMLKLIKTMLTNKPVGE